MMVMLRALLVAGLVFFHLEACSASSYTLYHRIGASQPWSKRGEIVAASEAGEQRLASPIYRDSTGEEQPWSSIAGYESWSEELYQLALTKDDEPVDEATTPMTFVRACHLATDSDESITVHTDASGHLLLGVNYELTGLQADQLSTNGCPIRSIASPSKQVSVQINKPQEVLNLAAPSPPPAKADGTPLQPGEKPPQEQSFFRKYWYIILPVVLLMVIPTELADANNEEAENGAGGDAPFAGGVQKGRVAGAAGGSARKR